MILESVQTLVEHSVGGQPQQQQHRHTQEGTRRMSLVDLGKRLLEAAKRGETDAVRALMSNGAPFTTDWVSNTLRNPPTRKMGQSKVLYATR